MHVCTESKLYSCVHVEVRRLDSTCTFHIDLAYYCEEGAHGGKSDNAQIICDFLKSH